MTAYILVLKPGCEAEDHESTDAWGSAETIPGVTVLPDPDGVEARRFGVETSGHVLVYGSDARRLFSGGITGARGHAGDNLGRDSLVSLLNNGSAECCVTPVFGCALFAPRQTDECGKDGTCKGK